MVSEIGVEWNRDPSQWDDIGNLANAIASANRSVVDDSEVGNSGRAYDGYRVRFTAQSGGIPAQVCLQEGQDATTE